MGSFLGLRNGQLRICDLSLPDPSCECSGPLYFMYRDLAKSDADWNWLHHHQLRYDLTVIPSRDLCGEWVKTKGHYHPKNPAGIRVSGDL